MSSPASLLYECWGENTPLQNAQWALKMRSKLSILFSVAPVLWSVSIFVPVCHTVSLTSEPCASLNVVLSCPRLPNHRRMFHPEMRALLRNDIAKHRAFDYPRCSQFQEYVIELVFCFSIHFLIFVKSIQSIDKPPIIINQM